MHLSGPASFQEEVNFRMNPTSACPSPFSQKSISYNNAKPQKGRKGRAAQAVLRPLQGRRPAGGLRGYPDTFKWQCQNRRPKTGYLLSVSKEYHWIRNWNIDFLYVSLIWVPWPVVKPLWIFLDSFIWTHSGANIWSLRALPTVTS